MAGQGVAMRRRSPAAGAACRASCPTTSGGSGSASAKRRRRAATTKRAASGPMELAAAVRPGHIMAEVALPPELLAETPALEWDAGADRPKLETCLRADGEGGLLISDGRRVVSVGWGAAGGSSFEVAGQEHRVLGAMRARGTSECALVLYEPESGRVVRVPLLATTAAPPPPPAAAAALGGEGEGASAPAAASLPQCAAQTARTPSLLVALCEPFPKPQQLLLHAQHEGVVVTRSRTHLQLLEPGPDRQQRVRLEARSGFSGCPQFSVSSIWSSGAVHPETGDVYFLDNSGACLFRWETQPVAGASQISCVAQWDVVQGSADEDPKLHAVDRLAVGSSYLLAWGGRGRSFRLLRIALGCFAVQAVDLLSQSGVLFRRPKFHREVLRLSGDVLYMAVFKSDQPSGPFGRLERLFTADLACDESAPRIEELHAVDWASPAQPVSFRLRRDAEEEEDPKFEVLSVDRRVLCARSEYFRAMFGSEMREASAGVVDVPPEVSGPAFRCLVDYLHTDLIHPVKVAGFADTDPAALPAPALLESGLLCLDVAQLADRYQLLRLRRLAEAFVCAHALQLPTVLPLLARAHALGLEDVAEACLRVVARSWSEVKSSCKKELESFVRADPTMATIMLLRCPSMSLK